MILLNALAYILPKLLKLERTIRYWNDDIKEDETINIIIFKDEITIRTYIKPGVIEKFLRIKK